MPSFPAEMNKEGQCLLGSLFLRKNKQTKTNKYVLFSGKTVGRLKPASAHLWVGKDR